jgi:hypothetical protein
MTQEPYPEGQLAARAGDGSIPNIVAVATNTANPSFDERFLLHFCTS